MMTMVVLSKWIGRLEFSERERERAGKRTNHREQERKHTRVGNTLMNGTGMSFRRPGWDGVGSGKRTVGLAIFLISL